MIYPPKLILKLATIEKIKNETEMAWNLVLKTLFMQEKFYAQAIMAIHAKFKWMTEILILDYVWVHFISESGIYYFLYTLKSWAFHFF